MSTDPFVSIGREDLGEPLSATVRGFHCEKMQQTYLVGIENRRIRK